MFINVKRGVNGTSKAGVRLMSLVLFSFILAGCLDQVPTPEETSKPELSQKKRNFVNPTPRK
jgi:hypothetical protein